MRGGSTLMFFGILGAGLLALQWARQGNRAAKAAVEALDSNPYNENPNAPVHTDASATVSTSHPTVVGTALGFGYRYSGDPYAHE